MKQLFLIRHGEAGFSDGLDFERNLSQNGRNQLSRLRIHLKKRISSIDKMFCSSANRTKETASMLEEYILIHDKEYLKEIYEANLETLINILENCPNDHQSCIIVGHNPTLSLLVSHLAGESYLNLQTGMLAYLELELSDWKMIGFNTCVLKEVIQ